MMTFKNALCIASIPEAEWSGLSHRYRYCQRRANHDGPHMSWSREWQDGDRESKPRRREKEVSDGK